MLKIKIIEGPISIKIMTGDPLSISVLNDALKYRVDSYWRSDAYQLFKRTGGKHGWDGYCRPLSLVKGERGLVATAWRGWLDDVLVLCRKLDISIDGSGLLDRPFKNIVPDDIPDGLLNSEFELDDNQRTGISLWLKHGIGIIQATVSSGKTAMFCGAASYIKRYYPEARILYLVPTERLVKQAVANAREFLPEMDIGQWGGGKHEFQAEDMVIATGASVGRNYEKLLKEGWFKTFTALFCDESHRVAGPTMQKICKTIPAFFRFGASDSTREDQPGVFADIKSMLGPIRHRVAVDPLIKIGRVAKPSIYYIDIPEWDGKFAHIQHEAQPDTRAWAFIDGAWVKGMYKGPALKVDDDGNIMTAKKKVPVLDSNGKRVYKHGFAVNQSVDVPIQNPGWHLIEDEEGGLMEVESRWCLLERSYDKAITRNKDRNDLIGMWAKHFSDQGKQTLIVCTRTLHVMILENLIKKLINPDLVQILFSRHSPKERDETFDWLKATPGSVLITPLVKEGVSINEIRAGIVADHVVSHEVSNQIIGRFIRKKPDGIDNSAEIVMFYDRQHPKMKKNSVELITQLEKIRGYTYYHPVSTPDSIVSATKFEEVWSNVGQ